MGASAHVGGTAQRYRQEIGRCIGVRGLEGRRGAQVNRKMYHEVEALEEREGQQRVRCQKTCGREDKRTEIIRMTCSTLRIAPQRAYRACQNNGRILLANLFQGSRSTLSCVSFPR